jgi:hypothetical protein
MQTDWPRKPGFGLTMARAAGMSTSMSVDPRSLNYANSNINIQEIMIRQLNEDLSAYKYDLEYCTNQLNDQSNMTPQETRTLQLRILDLGHQIRHCHHRTEILRHEMGATNGNVGTSQLNRSSFSALPNLGNDLVNPVPNRATGSTTGTPSNRRTTKTTPAPKRPRPESTPYDNSALAKRARVAGDMDDSQTRINAIQRLGYWKCRLCASEKYLTAGEGRQPSGPCKWPLKDVAKMIAHFTELHAEHTPRERCKELGDALDTNRE